MKKILSLILACVMCFSVMSVSAFADTTSTEDLFGVILDADGNIVERLVTPRDIYLDQIYTIPAGGKLITYQYEPTICFTFGFKTYDKNGKTITEANSWIQYTVEMTNTIGDANRGSRGLCNYTPSDSEPKRFLDTEVGWWGFRYYNGSLTNKSEHTIHIRVIVSLNQGSDLIPDP